MATDVVEETDVTPDTQTETPTEAPAPEATEVSEDDVKSHPTYKELQEKSEAHEQDAKTAEGRLKKANEEKNRYKKALVDEEEVEPEEKEETPSVGFTQKDKDDLKWEIKNQNKIDLAQEEYESYREKGMNSPDALRLAHLDKGITEENVSEHLRQSESSVPGGNVHRDDKPEIPESVRKDMEIWGYSEETYLENKDALAAVKRR